MNQPGFSGATESHGEQSLTKRGAAEFPGIPVLIENDKSFPRMCATHLSDAVHRSADVHVECLPANTDIAEPRALTGKVYPSWLR